MLSVKDENNVFQVYLETETGYFTDHTTLTMITSTKMATNNCWPTCSRWWKQLISFMTSDEKGRTLQDAMSSEVLDSSACASTQQHSMSNWTAKVVQ